MNTIITFGQHKGKDIEWLIKYEKKYCKWVIDSVKNSYNKDIKKFRDLLEEIYNEYIESVENNNLIKSAWYSHKDAKKLLNNDLEPYDYVEREFMLEKDNISYKGYLEFIFDSKEDEIDKDKLYEKIYYLGLMNDEDRLIKKEFAKIMISLRSIYDSNKEWDEKQTLPSKIILNYWITPKEIKQRNTGTGKWCLFYNKIIENNGLTELDEKYLLLKNNYNEITQTFHFKCSTIRPNENDCNHIDGVIVIYCDEETRDDIIKKINNLLKFERKIYWKTHSGNYSKDGVKTSSYLFDP